MTTPKPHALNVPSVNSLNSEERDTYHKLLRDNPGRSALALEVLHLRQANSLLTADRKPPKTIELPKPHGIHKDRYGGDRYNIKDDHNHHYGGYAPTEQSLNALDEAITEAIQHVSDLYALYAKVEKVMLDRRAKTAAKLDALVADSPTAEELASRLVQQGYIGPHE